MNTHTTFSILALATVFTFSATALGQDGLQSLLLDRVPAGALEIGEAMKSAKVGESIVVRGRITDGSDVFIANRAIFRLADESSVPPCCAPGQEAKESASACAVPADKRATIQFLRDGQLLNIGLKNKHGLAVGKEVFIVGSVHQADNEKSLIINATGMHVPDGNVPFGLFLASEPDEALNVIDAKKVAKAGEPIAVRGRIGGSLRPFVNGRTVFTIVGRGPLACSDVPDDHCSTPWDYCCVSRREILDHSATIQLVDDKGAPLRTDIKGRRNITELTDLTIAGTVVSAERGALIVNASGIYVHARE